MNENGIQVFMNEVFGEIRILEQNDGKVLFCGKDVADSLGYAIPSKAINAHCKGVSKLEVPTNGGIQNMLFITEGDLYRLITHSRRPDAEKFERWVFDDVLPSIRKHGSYSVQSQFADLSPQLQVLIQMETRQKQIEARQVEQATALAGLEQKLQNTCEVIALDKTAWRKDSEHLINKIARATGEGYGGIRLVYEEIYRSIESRAGVSLNTRLTNKRNRMAGEGVCKSKRDKLTRIDIIAEDKKLIEIYVAIVKELAVKYGVCA
ncbi:MAG TPA: hypothetical protein DC019_00195 [Ruminococcus sp.]|jgi:prophage antirepressor-like protein|nr:hypothetical protein [Ruminococcus sp.]